MPPFLGQGPEAVLHHDLPQQHAHLVLLRGDALIVRVAQLAEIVEGAAHVDLPLRAHVEQGQVHRAAAAVAGMLVDVALGEELVFFQLRIEIFLHPGVVCVQRPVHEMGHRHLGPVGVEDLQPVAHAHQLVAGLFQGGGGLRGQKSQGLLIAVDAVAHEIVGGVVAYLQDSVGHGLAEQHEVGRIVRQDHPVLGLGGIGLRVLFRPAAAGAKEQQQGQAQQQRV